MFLFHFSAKNKGQQKQQFIKEISFFNLIKKSNITKKGKRKENQQSKYPAAINNSRAISGSILNSGILVLLLLYRTL
jgi:hypothetical protein